MLKAEFTEVAKPLGMQTKIELATGAKATVLRFDADPLAYVCAKIRASYQLTDIHEDLTYKGRLAMRPCIDPEDLVLAEKIKKYFLNSIMMRRLNSLPVSRFMETVERIFDDTQPVTDADISALVKLPSFYDESMATAAIFNQHKTLDAPGEFPTASRLDAVVTFAGMVHRRSNNQNQERYYFSTDDGYLLAAFIKTSDVSSPAWAYLASKPSFRIKGNFYAQRQAGNNFYFYEIGFGYEIYDS